MLRIRLEQGKLFVGTIPYARRQLFVCPPKTFRGAVFHSVTAGEPGPAARHPALPAPLRPAALQLDPSRCAGPAAAGQRTRPATPTAPATPAPSAPQSRVQSPQLCSGSCRTAEESARQRTSYHFAPRLTDPIRMHSTFE